MLALAAVPAFLAAAGTICSQAKKGDAPAPGPKRPATPPSAKQTVATDPTLLRPRRAYKFPVGQTYAFSGEWRIFKAGQGTLRLEREGREYHVIGTASATGAVAKLFHVQDRYESLFDPASFCSHSTSRHTEEGLRRVETKISFDYRHGKVVFDQQNIKKNESKHEEHPIGKCVTDMVSAIYYVASLPLAPGGAYTFPLNDGGETINVTVHVEAREKVKTPAGTFNAIRIQPESDAGLFKKGKIWIWYSDDAVRVPVQARAHMTWGTLTLTLQRIDKK